MFKDNSFFHNPASLLSFDRSGEVFVDVSNSIGHFLRWIGYIKCMTDHYSKIRLGTIVFSTQKMHLPTKVRTKLPKTNQNKTPKNKSEQNSLKVGCFFLFLVGRRGRLHFRCLNPSWTSGGRGALVAQGPQARNNDLKSIGMGLQTRWIGSKLDGCKM